MVKAIFPNSIKKVATTVMFTTAVLGASANELKRANEANEVNQTELVSKEAATAIKNQAVIKYADKTEHNKKIDELLLDTCNNSKETKEIKKSMDLIYGVLGTYGAMIELQRSLDDFYVDEAFDKYLQQDELTEFDKNNAAQVISHFQGWKDNVYYSELFESEIEMYDRTTLPDADACLAVLDNHINNKEFFAEDDKIIYNEFSNFFLSKQRETESVQAKSNLIAYKVHLLNSLAFNNYFSKADKMPKEKLFALSLANEFINGKGVVKP